MKFIINEFKNREKADCLVIPFFENAEIATTSEIFASFMLPLKTNDFKGKVKEQLLFYPSSDMEQRVLLIGLGKKEAVSLYDLRACFANAVRMLIQKDFDIDKVSVLYPDLLPKNDETLTAVIEGLFCSNYVFNKFKVKNKKKCISSFQILGINEDKRNILDEIINISEAINLTRDLVNDNACDIVPKQLYNVAESFKKISSKVKVSLIDEKKMEKDGFGLILAVNKGSSVDPCLIQLDYKGNPNSNELIVLVGKGVTYDTGGLSLKPSTAMDTMKSDMTGASVVLGVIYALCKLNLPINVTGLIPSVENAIGPNSYKPGDVYKGYSGKTVEVVNTDAEGRLILADALAYASDKLKPNIMIDVATLTGAILIALGDEIAGLFSDDDELASKLLKASENTSELLWRLPLHANYKKDLKSEIADLKNCGGRNAGSMTAGLFLKEFVSEKVKWAHMDIAGTGFLKNDNNIYTKNSSGYGIRLFINFLKSFIKK